MIALLLALLHSPSPALRWEDEVLCWSDSGYCTRRVVNLGDWDPAPAAKDWPSNVPLNAPKPWSPGETN